MLSLTEYLNMAERCIIKWGNPKWMLQDDYIGAVASKLMTADHNYDQTKLKTVRPSSKRNWLIVNAKWAIYKIANEKKREQPTVSLDENVMTCAAQRDETQNNSPFNFNEMLNMGGISDDDKEILRMKFVEGISDREIGERMGYISKQAVLKRRVRALNLIKYGLACNKKASK